MDDMRTRSFTFLFIVMSDLMIFRVVASAVVEDRDRIGRDSLGILRDS